MSQGYCIAFAKSRHSPGDTPTHLGIHLLQETGYRHRTRAKMKWFMAGLITLINSSVNPQGPEECSKSNPLSHGTRVQNRSRGGTVPSTFPLYTPPPPSLPHPSRTTLMTTCQAGPLNSMRFVPPAFPQPMHFPTFQDSCLTLTPLNPYKPVPTSGSQLLFYWKN